MIISGLPIDKVATKLRLNETMLRRWVMRLGKSADEAGAAADYASADRVAV